MKRLRIVQYLATGIASFALMLPPAASVAKAQQPQPVQFQPTTAAPRAPAILDVSLDDEGVLTGQVVDRQGAPLAQTMVTVRSGSTILAVSKTDAQGQFSVGNLKGGTYQLIGAGSGGVYRVWTADASPPLATDQVTIVGGESVMPEQAAPPPGNGQCGPACNGQCGPCCRCYPYRRMQGCCCPVTNGQVFVTSLYAIGFGGLVTGIIIATVDLHEQESGS